MFPVVICKLKLVDQVLGTPEVTFDVSQKLELSVLFSIVVLMQIFILCNIFSELKCKQGKKH